METLMALAYAETLRDNQLDEITSFAGTSALLRIYDGSRPATGGAATTLLAELTCDATAFAAAATGAVLTLEAIVADSSANATATATWFRIVKSDGTTHVMDGDVGTSGSDLNLNSVAITTGAEVSVTSFTITAGNA
jgi:hypothetical protein